MAAERRLFFALWPAAAIADELHAAARAAHVSCGGRLMRRETLHVTLAFLGDVPESRFADVLAVAPGATAPAFLLELDRLGHWPHSHIVWAGCTAAPAALPTLADDLAQGLRAAGFRLDDRPYAAHATLLRNAECRSGAPPLTNPIRWAVEDFALVESHRGADGSRYEVLRRWPLAAAID